MQADSPKGAAMSNVMKLLDNIIDPNLVEHALRRDDWKMPVDAGYLMLLELLVKKSAGYHISYTEGRFLAMFKLRNKDGQPNKVGREFIMRMCYASSNNKSQACILGNKYRKDAKS